MILWVIVTACLAAAKSLEGLFNALRSEEELEKEMERGVKIPVVSQDEGSLGESSSSSPEKPAPTNT